MIPLSFYTDCQRIAERSHQHETMSLVQNSEICVADVIIKKQYITVDGRLVYGSDEESSIAVQAHTTSLRIWVTKQDFQEGPIPFDECLQELGDAMGIPGPNRHLALLILNNDNQTKIERRLEQANYGRPVDTSTFTAAHAAAARAARPRVLDLTPRARNRPALVTVASASAQARGVGNTSARTNTMRSGHTNGYVRPRQEPLLSGSVVGYPNSYEAVRAPHNRGDRALRPRAPAYPSRGTLSAHQSADSNFDISSMDLAPIRATLRRGLQEEDVIAAASLLGQSSTTVETAATKAELAIGMAGEKFVSAPEHRC